MTPDDVLMFWFNGEPSVWRKIWFQENLEFDTACAAFGEARQAAVDGALDAWRGTPAGMLALILLLDQFSRNLFRGSAEAFAADSVAREAARTALDAGFDQAVTPVQRGFLYLPFMHSESLADQDRSVSLFETLPALEDGRALSSAHKHREVIRRFGRFPHRNAALERESTAEEAAFLAAYGRGF